MILPPLPCFLFPWRGIIVVLVLGVPSLSFLPLLSRGADANPPPPPKHCCMFLWREVPFVLTLPSLALLHC